MPDKLTQLPYESIERVSHQAVPVAAADDDVAAATLFYCFPKGNAATAAPTAATLAACWQLESEINRQLAAGILTAFGVTQSPSLLNDSSNIN